MKSSLLKITLTSFFTVFSSFAQSAPVTFSFQSILEFDPTLGIAAGGETVGDVFDAIYGTGTGASGQLALTGSLTYDDNTPVYQQALGFNGNGAGHFLSPITGLQLNIGGTTVNADIASINANNDLSSTWAGLAELGGVPEFCLGDLADCLASNPNLDLAMTRTSNTAYISDNKLATGNARDTIVFFLGSTGVANDFSPVFDTGTLGLGDVFVDRFVLVLQGNPVTELWDGYTTLPDNNSAFDPANFDIALVGVGFNGDGVNEFFAEGTLATVPIPAAVWLFGSGLIGLMGMARRRSNS